MYHKLPNRRSGFNQVLTMSDGTKVSLRTGEYKDGTLGEIVLDAYKEGTSTRALLTCFASAVSIGLQYGVPLTTYTSMFKNVMFEPKGLVTGSSHITEATSMVDAIFKELESEYSKS